MKFQNFLALARENLKKNARFVADAREKRSIFFTSLLFYKQNAPIYARIFFNAAKMYTYKFWKISLPPPLSVNFGLRPSLKRQLYLLKVLLLTCLRSRSPDNGKNFVGAEKILKDELKGIDQGKIHSQMSQK